MVVLVGIAAGVGAVIMCVAVCLWKFYNTREQKLLALVHPGGPEDKTRQAAVGDIGKIEDPTAGRGGSTIGPPPYAKPPLLRSKAKRFLASHSPEPSPAPLFDAGWVSSSIVSPPGRGENSSGQDNHGANGRQDLFAVEGPGSTSDVSLVATTKGPVIPPSVGVSHGKGITADACQPVGNGQIQSNGSLQIDGSVGSVTGRGMSTGYDERSGDSSCMRGASGLSVAHAVLEAAETLAKNCTTIPGVAQAAMLVAVLVSLATDHRSNVGAIAGRVRFCRSIVTTLERAAEVLGKVRNWCRKRFLSHLSRRA